MGNSKSYNILDNKITSLVPIDNQVGDGPDNNYEIFLIYWNRHTVKVLMLQKRKLNEICKQQGWGRGRAPRELRIKPKNRPLSCHARG